MPSKSIAISDSDKELAKLLAKARTLIKPRHIRYNDSHFHKGGGEKDERWWPHFIGLLGEIAYCRGNKIPLCFDVKAKGDEEDLPGIEVKTRVSKDKNPLLIIKEGEFKKKTPDFYVLIRLEPDLSSAEIVGSVSREDFAKNATEMQMRGRTVLTLRADKIREGFSSSVMDLIGAAFEWKRKLLG